MLRRNIDTSKGLVNRAVAIGSVISIKAHHIAVQFDNIPEAYQVEKVKSRFVVMKKIYVFRKQFPLILAFAVTIHKCQGLSLDCGMMELSDQVYSPGMAYVALSPVKQLENLHLIAFKPESVMVSTKCLHEINRLRQTYRPDLPQYTVPSAQQAPQTRKRSLTGSLLSFPPPPKQKRVVVSSGTKRKLEPQSGDKQSPPEKKRCTSGSVDTRPEVQSRYRYNPVSVEWQRRVCQELGLRFVRANRCTAGGPDVRLKHPASVKTTTGDGNCLFRALCTYACHSRALLGVVFHLLKYSSLVHIQR